VTGRHGCVVPLNVVYTVQEENTYDSCTTFSAALTPGRVSLLSSSRGYHETTKTKAVSYLGVR